MGKWKTAKDITGMRVGTLTVLGPTNERKFHETAWRCRCDCGREVLVRRSNLTMGRVKSCGCGMHRAKKHKANGEAHTVKEWAMILCVTPATVNNWLKKDDLEGLVKKRMSPGRGLDHIGNLEDLTGERVGSLTVVKKVSGEGLGAKYLCRCDCGKGIVVGADRIRYNRIRNCGCTMMSRKEFDYFGVSMTMREWANMFGLKEGTVYNWIRTGSFNRMVEWHMEKQKYA